MEELIMARKKVEICGVNTSSLPLLSEEEKEDLFERIEQGDLLAREHYIKGNLRLVLSIIQRFSGSNENADDLFQVGCIGLMKAIDNFDRNLNVKFSTYAVPMIIGEVKRYLRDNHSMRVSRSLRDMYDYKLLLLLFVAFMISGFLGVSLYGNLILRILITLVVFGLLVINKNKFIDALKKIKER